MTANARPERGATMVDVVFGLWLVAVQVILFLLMRATSRTSNGDPYDSPLFWWSWLILPALACLVTIERPWDSRPLWWTAALIVPFMVEVAVLGTLLHDLDEGASFWLIGEFSLLVLGGLTAAGSLIGLRIRTARDPSL